MSEFTPTTERVQDAYVRGMRSVAATGEHREEFDRWLAEVERAAVERERAAIRSTIGAYTEHGVWAFDQAVGCIDRKRREEN